MATWIPMSEGSPHADALIAYYVPPGNYMWGVGADREFIRDKYPAASHYKIITDPPAKLEGPAIVAAKELIDPARN